MLSSSSKLILIKVHTPRLKGEEKSEKTEYVVACTKCFGRFCQQHIIAVYTYTIYEYTSFEREFLKLQNTRQK